MNNNNLNFSNNYPELSINAVYQSYSENPCLEEYYF